MAKPLDWSQLNAYVDGELDTSAAAAVAERAVSDAEVAERIAALHQLKAVTHQALAEAAPPPIRWPVSAARRRRAWAIRAAAAAAVVTVAAVGGWLLPLGNAELLPPDLLETAQALHGEWLAEGGRSQTATPPAALVSALARFGQFPTIPDLESAQLFIDRVDIRGLPGGGRVLQVGYLGRHGCHLSLFVFPDGGMPARPVREEIGAERAYGWQADGLGYLILARGMDHARFDLIAQKVEGGTRTRRPFDGATREALAESRRNSVSCAA